VLVLFRRTLSAEAPLVAGLILLAVLARFVGRYQETGDMRTFYRWHALLTDTGVWSGLGEEIGNYNAPFLYLLALTTWLPGPLILKIKAIWLAFDLLLIYYTYRTVALRWPGRRIPMLAALIVALMPTVVVNASFYGQTDSMWAAFALGGVYHLLRDEPWWGVSLCAVALALKPQGIFIFPLLLLLVLAGRIRWRTLLAAPAVYLALDLPAILAGRDPVELLTIYDPNRQAIHVPDLTSNAPSVFVFFPIDTRVGSVKNLGYLFTAALILGVCYVLVARRVKLTPERVVLAAATFAILMPYTLPGMHERYFYLADVLTLVLAFYRWRLWYVPLLVQGASLLSYAPFLFGRSPRLIDPMILGAMMLAALVATTYSLVREAAVDPGPEPGRATVDEPPSAPPGPRSATAPSIITDE
jgi:Gpi18-like mannosyltransferase